MFLTRNCQTQKNWSWFISFLLYAAHCKRKFKY